MPSIQDTYAERCSRFKRETKELKRTSSWFPWGRAFTFLGGGGLMLWGWTGEHQLPWLGWVGLGLFIGFIILVVIHRRIQREIEDTELMGQVNQRGLERLASGWMEFEEDGTEFKPPADHPYAGDIDILGRSSLFQRINTTATQFGAQTLASWLLNRASIEEIERRQKLVEDLQGRLEFRQHLESEGRRLQTNPTLEGPEPFLEWVEAPAKLWNQVFWVWLVRLLPLFTVGALLWYQVKPISFWWWFAPLVVQVGILSYFLRMVTPILSKVAYRERAFSLYSALFNHVDSELTTPKQPLANVQKQLREQGAAPQVEMSKIQKIVDLIEFRQSPLIHLPLNFLLLWDVHCLLFLESWKERTRPHVRQWFQTLGEIEALACLANHAEEMPLSSFPEIVTDETLVFEAEELGHPLLDVQSRVYNDVTLDPDTPFLLITGSNMSGKSTFLRAMAINSILAYAGGKVNAKNLRLSIMQVATSMRISDSLEHGISYFMAELKRIRRVIDFRTDETPLFYLLDEILHGTNTFERRKAALGVVTLLQQGNALGAVTTHDLELAEDCKRFGSAVYFAYFRDLIREQEMVFDYKLQEGICPTTNALRLMRIVGIPLPDEEEETTSN